MWRLFVEQLAPGGPIRVESLLQFLPFLLTSRDFLWIISGVFDVPRREHFAESFHTFRGTVIGYIHMQS